MGVISFSTVMHIADVFLRRRRKKEIGSFLTTVLKLCKPANDPHLLCMSTFLLPGSKFERCICPFCMSLFAVYTQHCTIEIRIIESGQFRFSSSALSITMQCNAMQCNAMQCNAMQCIGD